jgi:tRNA threonylcarbamoyladenosine modification (KEOPS) complex Cgi121 subunit
MSIEYFQEYDRYVLINGVRNAKVVDPRTTLQQLRAISSDVEVQLLDAKVIAGKDHLRFAVLNALKSQTQRKQITDSLAVEILLYASAQRQIKNAIAALGVSPSSENLAVVAVANEKAVLERLEPLLANVLTGELDESVLEEGDVTALKKTFGIAEDHVRVLLRRDVGEREAVARLVIEKMALLSSQI